LITSHQSVEDLSTEKVEKLALIIDLHLQKFCSSLDLECLQKKILKIIERSIKAKRITKYGRNKKQKRF
jgi:hypothetical protein